MVFFPDESDVPPCISLGLRSACVHFRGFVTLVALVCTWLLSDCNVEKKERTPIDLALCENSKLILCLPMRLCEALLQYPNYWVFL